MKVNNSQAHELTTGSEIINAILLEKSTSLKPSSKRVDVLVAGAGTGGTITGVSRATKKACNATEIHDLTKAHNLKCVVIGVDPVGYNPNQPLGMLIYQCHRKEAFSLSPILSIWLMKGQLL